MLLLTIATYKAIVVGLLMIISLQWLKQEADEALMYEDEELPTHVVDENGNLREMTTEEERERYYH